MNRLLEELDKAHGEEQTRKDSEWSKGAVMHDLCARTIAFLDETGEFEYETYKNSNSGPILVVYLDKLRWWQKLLKKERREVHISFWRIANTICMNGNLCNYPQFIIGKDDPEVFVQNEILPLLAKHIVWRQTHDA